MRLAAALIAAALLAGCGDENLQGFTATPPGGWEEETDNAETRTGSDFEVVYEGIPVEGIKPIISVTRVEAAKERKLEAAAAAARLAIDRRLDEADPTPVASAELGGEPALRFDYGTGERRARYITARHGDHLYAVTLQSATSGFDRALVVFDDFLAGWRWE